MFRHVIYRCSITSLYVHLISGNTMCSMQQHDPTPYIIAAVKLFLLQCLIFVLAICNTGNSAQQRHQPSQPNHRQFIPLHNTCNFSSISIHTGWGSIHTGWGCLLIIHHCDQWGIQQMVLRVCSSVCVAVWIHISVTAGRNFLILGLMVGMMPSFKN